MTVEILPYNGGRTNAGISDASRSPCYNKKAMEEASCCHGNESGGSVRVGKKLAVSLAGLLCLFAVSFLPPLEALNASLANYLVLLAPPLLLGFLLGGAIDYFVPPGIVHRYLGTGKKSSIPFAFLGGFLMSACSHGILAVAIELYRKGAGVPAVVTFLLASPWANLPVTVLLVSFFGWKGILFILTAGFIAVVTGFVFRALESRGHVEKNPSSAAPGDCEWERIRNFSLRESVAGVLRGSLALSNMVLWWIVIGLLAAVLIDVYVPGELFARYLGPDARGLLLTLGAATLIEVCSEASSVVALEIYDKTGSFGNPFVFLMAGVVTDYTEIGLLWTAVGKKTALLLPAVAVPQVLFFGFLYNAVL